MFSGSGRRSVCSEVCLPAGITFVNVLRFSAAACVSGGEAAIEMVAGVLGEYRGILHF